ncbi:MAG: hypothetical protein HZB38_16860 [Planctomycetes bacterium]|nr:hypothetical protein [Planctomycetota bacterium]
MTRLNAHLVVLFLAAAAPARPAEGDILYLRDGTRYSGEVVSETEREVAFRVVTGEGRSSVVRVFPASRVRSIEHGGKLRTRPAASDDAADSTRFEQMVREAFELLDDHDLAAALRAFQKAVTGCPREQLPELDALSRRQRKTGLAEVIAVTRITQAERGAPRVPFEIRFATPYEAAVLGQLLEAIQGDAMREVFAERTLAAWAETPEEFREVTPDARRMVDLARKTAGVIAARLKFDPRARSAGDCRAALVHSREQLTSLSAQVAALRGFTALQRDVEKDDPTLAEAERLLAAEEEARRTAAEAAASQPSDEDSPTTQPAETEGPTSNPSKETP